MAAPTIFNQDLTGSFVATRSLLITADEVTLFWTLVTAGENPVFVEFYLEFCVGDPTNDTNWFREVDEEDTGDGVVNMAKVIRTFHENGGAGLAAGTHRLSTQFLRNAPMVRLQVRINGGGSATATIVSASGELTRPL